MANDFKIVISAQDRATASIRKVNDSMSRITRPLADAHKSTVAIGKELSKNPIVKGLGRVKDAAEGVAAGIMKISGPMLGLTGIGVVAGIAQLATNWGRLGFELKNTSSSLGISTQSLQSMHGVAKLAGYSAESMTSALSALNQNLFNAKNGGDPELVGIMKNLGISFHETADGGFDTIKVLKDVARAMAAQKSVGAKHSIAQRLGVDEIYTPISKGVAEMERLEQAYKKVGGASTDAQIEKATAFTAALNKLGVAADGVKNSLGDKMIPAVQPLIDRLTSLLSSGSQALGNASPHQLNNASKLGAMAIPGPLRAAASAWGWLLEQMDGGSKQPAARSASTVSASTLGAKALRYNSPQLNAYAAKVEKEMGLWPNWLNGIKNYGERSNSDQVSPSGAKGVMQFMPKTWAKYGKGDITDPFDSIDAAGRYGKDLMKRYGGNRDAATTEYNGGVDQARAVQQGGKPWRAESVNYLPRVNKGIESMNDAQAGSQSQNMTITLAGLPPGVTATAKSSTGTPVPVRISRAMPAESTL
ncbi:MAG: transglycosylase SLT domain-containing protein [Janthinobacterium lividum]